MVYIDMANTGATYIAMAYKFIAYTVAACIVTVHTVMAVDEYGPCVDGLHRHGLIFFNRHQCSSRPGARYKARPAS